MDFQFTYRLGGKNAKGLHSNYDGCEGPLANCGPDCSITRRSSSYSSDSNGGAGKRKELADAEERRKKGKKGVELFLSRRTRKDKTICKCTSGTKCGFLHVGGN